MVDLSGAAPGLGSAVSGLTTRRLLLAMSSNLAWLATLAITAALCVSFYLYEGLVSNAIFTTGVTLAIGAAFVLATRRLLFSAVAVALMVLAINGIAAAKMRTIGMVLHAYDVVFYLGSWSTLAYLWFSARVYVVGFIVGIGLVVLIATFAWRFDPTRIRRLSAVLAFALGIAVASYAGLTKPDRRHTQFYWNALYVSSFYSSWAETLETFWRGQLIEAANAATAQPFSISKQCTPAVKPPHIILVHQESVVQPDLFPELGHDKRLDPFFRSGDGKLHKLRVETYGGASWLTEFSILTGLSTHSFGGMRPFVQSLLAGKIRDTLPEALERCGYRNVLFYPMLKNFVSNSRFYDAVGMREVIDMKAQGAKSETERDRFYYGNALSELGRHIERSGKPQFTYIQTMSVHWPYDYVYEPDEKVPGGAPGTDPELHEYLRRVAIAKLDFDAFKAELARRFPDEKFLLVQYGDHHPMATRKLLGFDDDTQAEEVAIDPLSKGFITYFSTEGINYQPPPLPSADIVDVPYLGALILSQAGVPLSEPNQERLRLLNQCDGRYHTCALRHEILAFHRRLIDSKLIDQK